MESERATLNGPHVQFINQHIQNWNDNGNAIHARTTSESRNRSKDDDVQSET